MKTPPVLTGGASVQPSNRAVAGAGAFNRIDSPRQHVRRRRRRNPRPAPYDAMIARLRPADRRRVNETIIAAVIALTNADGEAPIGAKAFLESRGRQLIVDFAQIGWGRASARFQVAVAKWAKSHPLLDQGSPDAGSNDLSEISQ